MAFEKRISFWAIRCSNGGSVLAKCLLSDWFSVPPFESKTNASELLEISETFQKFNLSKVENLFSGLINFIRMSSNSHCCPGKFNREL